MRVARERTAAQTGDRTVEQPHAHLQGGINVGTADAARVVQVQANLRLRYDRAHRADAALDLLGMGPAHGVGQVDHRQRHTPVGAGIDQPADLIGQDRQRHGTTEIAAKGRDHVGLFHRNAQDDVAVQPAELAFTHLGHAAVVVALRKRLGGVEHQLAVQVHLFAGARTLEAVVVEPERRVAGARALGDGGKQLGCVGHLRHRARTDEGRHLDLLQARGAQSINQRGAIRQRIGFWLHLEALARAFLMELDGGR